MYCWNVRKIDYKMKRALNTDLDVDLNSAHIFQGRPGIEWGLNRERERVERQLNWSGNGGAFIQPTCDFKSKYKSLNTEDNANWPAHIGSLDSDINPLLSFWLVSVEHLGRNSLTEKSAHDHCWYLPWTSLNLPMCFASSSSALMVIMMTKP